MRARLRWASCLALALFSTRSSFAGEESTLRVGMQPWQPPWTLVPGRSLEATDMPPMNEVEPGRLEGFDVDVMKALGVSLGARMQIVPTLWGDLEQGLLDERFDLIISGWTPNSATPEGVVASEPYCDWGLLLVVPATNTKILTPTDLVNLRVGHLADPAVNKALRAMGGGQFHVYDTQQRLFADLKAGRLDALIYDSLYVEWRLAHDPSLKAVGAPLNRLGYHVGVRRDAQALYYRVQKAVRALVASGEIERIRRKWVGP